MGITRDLTVGNETKAILKLALPMIAGNLFQQLYNIADTIIVGRFIGPDALAAVGSSFSLMVLLNSIILGFCMGSSENRKLCIFTRAGIWQCIFYIHSSESRRKGTGTYTKWDSFCCKDYYDLWCGSFGIDHIVS